MDDSASNLVGLIREIVREELKKTDKTSTCRVSSVNTDGTINLWILPDTSTIIPNILNCSGQQLKDGDIVVLFKIGNNISNSFIFAKYGPQQMYGGVTVSVTGTAGSGSGSGSGPQPTYEEYTGETAPTQMNTTATSADLLKDKTAFSNGAKIIGTIENYDGDNEPLN